MSVILFKLFSRKGVDAMSAVTVNYFTAFMLGMLLNVRGGEPVNPLVQEWLPWAVVGGVMFIASYMAMSLSTVTAGVAVTGFSSRLSLIIPVLLSALLFGGAERPDWPAMTVILVALALIIWGGGTESGRRGGAAGWLLPLSVFVLMGVCHFILKYVQSGIEERYSDADYVQSQFAALTSAIFVCAMMVGVGVSAVRWFRGRARRDGREVEEGCVAADFVSGEERAMQSSAEGDATDVRVSRMGSATSARASHMECVTSVKASHMGCVTNARDPRMGCVTNARAPHMGCVISVRAPHRSDNKQKFGVGEIVGGMILGVSNFFSTYLVLYALVSLPAVVFFPIYNVGVVLVATLAGVMLFGEKMGARQVAGMVLAAAGITLFFVG